MPRHAFLEIRFHLKRDAQSDNVFKHVKNLTALRIHPDPRDVCDACCNVAPARTCVLAPGRGCN